MKRRLALSVRRAIKSRTGVILFGIALGVGLLAGAGLGGRWSAAALRSIDRDSSKRSDEYGLELDAELRQRRRALNLVAGLPALRSDAASAHAAFAAFLATYREFDSVGYSKDAPPVPPGSAEGPRKFRLTESIGTVSLTAFLRPDWPERLMSGGRRFGLSEEGSLVVLVGRRGGRTAGQPFPIAPAQLISKAGSSGMRFWTDRREYLTVVHPLEAAPGLAIVVGVPEATLRSRSRSETLKGIGIGGLLGLIAGALAWGGVVRSTRRLRAINEALERRVADRTAELAAAERSFRGIFENVPLGLYHCDREGRFLRVNETLATTLGYDSPESLIEAVGSLNEIGEASARARFIDSIQEAGEARDANLVALRADGTPIRLSEQARAVRDDCGEVMFIEGAVSDVTAQRELEAQLRRIGETDALTGLLNRRGLTDAIASAQTPVSFVVLDVDHFKAFNDTYGHPAGDRALQAVSSAIRNSVRSTDAVARAGGEEFVVVLPRTGSEGAQRVAESLRTAVAACEELEAPLTVSVGVATAARRDEVADSFTAADRALYVAKERGRNQVVVNGAKLA